MRRNRNGPHWRRLSKLAETLSEVSVKRSTQPAKLSALVKGDLDWIVMKALEKDRGRRYETASAFATDAARDLIDRTILKPAVAAIDKQFAEQPLVDATLRQVLASRYRELGLLDRAYPLQDRVVAARHTDGTARCCHDPGGKAG